VSRQAVLDALDSVGSGAELFTLSARVFQLPAVLSSITAFAALGVGCIMAMTGPENTRLRHKLKRLVGPFSVGVIELSAGVTFLIQLLFSYTFCIVCILITVFSAICNGGSDVIAKAKELTALLSSSNNGPGLIKDFNMDVYCGVASDASGSAVALLVGTVLLVIGQAGLVACMSEYVGRVCHAAEASSREPFTAEDNKPEFEPKAEPKDVHDAGPQSNNAEDPLDETIKTGPEGGAAVNRDAAECL